MAVFCGAKDSTAAIAAVVDFKKECLVNGGSLFTDMQVWTPEHVQELVTYFVENLDKGAGTGDFLTKFKLQLADASDQAKILASEMMWLMMLCPSNIGVTASINNIKQVFEFSALQFATSIDVNVQRKYFNSHVLTGIGSAGAAYNTGRWRELCYLIRFSQQLLSLPQNERIDLLEDHQQFSQWLEQIPDNEKRQFRHMLLFLLFPKFNERIFGNSERKEILTKCTNITNAELKNVKAKDIGQRLYQLRQQFETQFGTAELDYYVEPLRSKWKVTTLNAETPDSQQNLLSTAINVDIPSASLNQILYGPPGTGKTYSTINKALEIIEPEFLVANKDDRTALKARFDSLVSVNRIGFVTFHQSFSYEDFVEGIKASTNKNNQVSYDVEDGIFKRMCDGASSKLIREDVVKPIDVKSRKVWKMSLGNTLGDDAYIYQQCIDKGHIALGYGDDINFCDANDRKTISQYYRDNGRGIERESYDFNVTSIHRFKNEVKVNDLVIISDGNNKFRAIGEVAGQYQFLADEDYSQIRKVNWLKTFSPSKSIEDLFTVRLQQQAIYQLRSPSLDFAKLDNLLNKSSLIDNKLKVGDEIDVYRIEFISPKQVELKKVHNTYRLVVQLDLLNELVHLVQQRTISIDEIRHYGVLGKVDIKSDGRELLADNPNVVAPLVAKMLGVGTVSDDQEQGNRRVLIIDEINRGNVASIFGELITLIEPSKRAGGDESISVKLPYSKLPFSVPSNLYIIGTMNTADKSLAQVDIALRRRFEFIEMMTDYDVLKTIEHIDGINIAQLVETINQRIELLYDREHTIGHSFFLSLKDEPTLAKLASIFALQILPLLEEYFFEDWERVGQVLGDHLKPNNELRFIVEKFSSSQISQLMGNDWEQPGIEPYVRNDAALTQPQAYIGIYEPIN
jgi:5-methylcytosine-specific restriction protein B